MEDKNVLSTIYKFKIIRLKFWLYLVKVPLGVFPTEALLIIIIIIVITIIIFSNSTIIIEMFFVSSGMLG